MSASEEKKVSKTASKKKDSTSKKSSKKDGKEEKKHIQHGVPDGVNIELGKHNPQPLEEQLFPQELEALKKLKKENPLAKEFNDYYLMSCLLSRKLDVERAGAMLERTIKYKEENGIERIPKFDELDKRLWESRHVWSVPGARSKNGHGIMYLIPARLIPKDFRDDDYKSIMHFQYWSVMRGSYCDGHIDTHRNGTIIVEDLTGLSMKHFDMKLQKKSGSMTDTFPMRIKMILLLNPPTILKAMLAIAKLFMKKKLFKRIKILKDQSELLEYIDKNQLHKDFGGDLTYSVDEWEGFVKEHTIKMEEDDYKEKKPKKKGKKPSAAKKQKKKEDKANAVEVSN